MIDWGQVKSLRDEVGHEDFDEVVELFLEEVEEEVVTRPPEQSANDRTGKRSPLSKRQRDEFGVFRIFDALPGRRIRAASGHAVEIDIDKVINCYAVSKTKFIEELPALVS